MSINTLHKGDDDDDNNNNNNNNSFWLLLLLLLLPKSIKICAITDGYILRGRFQVQTKPYLQFLFQKSTHTEASTTEGTVTLHRVRIGGKEGEISNQILFRSLERNGSGNTEQIPEETKYL